MFKLLQEIEENVSLSMRANLEVEMYGFVPNITGFYPGEYFFIVTENYEIINEKASLEYLKKWLSKDFGIEIKEVIFGTESDLGKFLLKRNDYFTDRLWQKEDVTRHCKKDPEEIDWWQVLYEVTEDCSELNTEIRNIVEEVEA